MSNPIFAAMPPTWGARTPPEMIAERPEVDRHLAAVPEGGTVIDLGAGVAMPLSAYVYSLRPDVHIVPVDPGYGLPGAVWDIQDARWETTALFAAEKQARLEASAEWYINALAAPAEELPIEDASADLIVSHAAVPDYADDPKMAAEEGFRVLKIGATALHGPISARTFKSWLALLENAQSQGVISTVQHEKRKTYVDESRTVTGFFTRITK